MKIEEGCRLRVPEVNPESEEIEAIREGRKDRAENGTVSHEEITLKYFQNIPCHWKTTSYMITKKDLSGLIGILWQRWD